MVSVMFFIVYGGVSGEAVMGGLFRKESYRCAYDQFAMVRA